jgi:catecholate siderophore receptor
MLQASGIADPFSDRCIKKGNLMKFCIPFALSVALGISISCMSTPVHAAETLEPVELELAEAPAAAAEETTLPQVTVQDKHTVERDKSYQGNKTRVGKTTQLPKDIPQSVTIVPEQLMKDRNANTLKEALRNVAGLTFNAGEGGRIGDNITLRGYSAVGDLYLDGLRDVAQYNRETFNLEQVEVLRGSASMLYGRGSTGGIINQVSKQPEEADRYEVNLTGGTNRYLRATVDLNKTLSKRLAFRLNAMDTSANSFRDDVSQKRWGIAPSLRWGEGTNNDVTLAYYFLHENNIPDYGVPYFDGRPLDVPIHRFYGLANADYEHNRASIASLTYVHRFNENSVIRTVLRQSDYARDLRATAPRLIGGPISINENTLINRQRQARGAKEHVLTSQTEYNGKFITGPLKHEVLGGYEFTWERSHRWTNTSPFANPRTVLGNPDTTPGLPSGFDDSFSRTAFNYYNGRTNSLYAQDTVQVIPHWKVLLGTRFDDMHVDYNRPTPAGPLTRDDKVWSYRGGLLYQPNALSTYYVSYGSSFNPSAELYQLDDRTANTPPEKSRNIEAGAKWELFGGDLSLRTAVFRSEKTNERNTDLSRPDVALLTGRRHTDGIEVETAGRITPNWQIFSSVALMRSNVDEASASQATALDKRPVNTPNYTYSLWSTYTLKYHGNWKIGAGLEGVGYRYATTNNLVSIPAYMRMDAMLEYSRKAYAIKLNIFNMLNRKYYEGIYVGHVVPGTPLAAQLSLNWKL